MREGPGCELGCTFLFPGRLEICCTVSYLKGPILAAGAPLGHVYHGFSIGSRFTRQGIPKAELGQLEAIPLTITSRR